MDMVRRVELAIRLKNRQAKLKVKLEELEKLKEEEKKILNTEGGYCTNFNGQAKTGIILWIDNLPFQKARINFWGRCKKMKFADTLYEIQELLSCNRHFQIPCSFQISSLLEGTKYEILIEPGAKEDKKLELGDIRRECIR